MTGSKVVQLAVGNEFAMRTPEDALLRVIDIELPINDLPTVNLSPLSKECNELLAGEKGRRGLPSRRGSSVCLLNLRPSSLTARFI